MISSPGTKRKITKRQIMSHNEMEGRRPFFNTEDTENEWSSMNMDIWVSFFLFAFEQVGRVANRYGFVYIENVRQTMKM